jgi:hypothetical protein
MTTATAREWHTLGGESRTPGACFAYYGDREDWPIVLAVHRDSDMIERSNFEAAQRMLDPTGESDDVAIERCSHWLVGWVEYLLIAPERADLIELAGDIKDRIEDYPILDESQYSEFTMERHDDQDCSNGCDECEYEREIAMNHDAGRCQDDCIHCERAAEHDETCSTQCDAYSTADQWHDSKCQLDHVCRCED